MALYPQTPQEIRLETQYQQLVGQYYSAQSDYYRAKGECLRLTTIVRAKQDVIEALLPYYPHQLPPELRYKIALQ